MDSHLIGPHDWDNPGVLAHGKEAAHATLMPYPDLQDALRAERLASPWCHVLNGVWKFAYAANPASAPDGFWASDYADDAWNEITQPTVSEE